MVNKENYKIIDFDQIYAADFKQLNLSWIIEHWTPEEEDYVLLENPIATIISKGGLILCAISRERLIGTCALINCGEGRFELSKMTVAKRFRGNGIGLELVTEAIQRAHQKKARSIYIESNTILRPAIQLYKKIGFQEIVGIRPAYKRCNIQLEMLLYNN